MAIKTTTNESGFATVSETENTPVNMELAMGDNHFEPKIPTNITASDIISRINPLDKPKTNPNNRGIRIIMSILFIFLLNYFANINKICGTAFALCLIPEKNKVAT
jgi:hypothetical protein